MSDTLTSAGLALAQLGVLVALAPGLNGLIKRMLYQPLEQYGYTGAVHEVELEFNGADALRVYISGEKAS